jgi:hypothetical protein
MGDSEVEAFVVWLERDPAGNPSGELRGQVEHVRSSQRSSFATREELLRFLDRAIAPGSARA